MGTPIPPPGPIDPVAPGELCVNCWGLDGIFGNGPTPSQITVEIDGVAKGPNWVPEDGDPPNGTYDLPQFLLGGPCLFLLEGGINLEVFFGPTNVVISGFKAPGFSFFISAPSDPCVLVVGSNLNDHFTGGTATITLPEIR